MQVLKVLGLNPAAVYWLQGLCATGVLWPAQVRSSLSVRYDQVTSINIFNQHICLIRFGSFYREPLHMLLFSRYAALVLSGHRILVNYYWLQCSQQPFNDVDTEYDEAMTDPIEVELKKICVYRSLRTRLLLEELYEYIIVKQSQPIHLKLMTRNCCK